MRTAELIEGMTDAGQFEVLATRVLRQLETDCDAIIHAGVNAQGKTIANPIDAFCLVPGSNPPRYVMEAFTLTAPCGLLDKWLFDHTTHKPTGKRKTPAPSESDDGDLIKAGREAERIRSKHPDAEFIVWLCTNRRLDTELQQPVYDKAAKMHVEVRFLEQSRLRDFLDMKPEGQWLRQEHLGIEADQISSSLLSRLSQASLVQYADSLMFPPQQEIVPTLASRAAITAIQGSESLLLLVGHSGAGKSVISHHMLHHQVNDEGFCLWIPAEVAERHSFLADAVDAVLRSLHSRAGNGAGHDALKLATLRHPILLVIDDINRSPDSVRLLRKIIGWARPAQSSDGSTLSTSNAVRIICPVWDAVWYPLQHTYESIAWIRVQRIGPMNRTEAIACLKATLGANGSTDTELGEFAERLHDDPILLGLFGRLVKMTPSANPLAISDNVIGRVVEQAIGELATVNRVLPADYLASLDQLSKEMIRRKVLYPRWEEVKAWLQAVPDVRTRLTELTAQSHVCRLSGATSASRFEFRHDRILEYQLSQAAAAMLLEADGDHEQVADPFFGSFVGRSIARANFSDEVLERVGQRNPVALIAAIPYLPTSPSKYATKVVQHARNWLATANNYPDSMRYDALWILARTQSPHVLDVTDGIQENRRVYEARLRNGDALAGASALSKRFFPASRFSWLESLIEEARTHHANPLIEQLRSILQSTSIGDQKRRGALCLAGYFGDPTLAADISAAWDKSEDKKDILLASLWAAFRCAGDTPAELIAPMLSHILSLHHDDSGQTMGERGALLQGLRFASRHGFGEAALSYLTEIGTSQADFRWIVVSILNDVDHPIAIKYVARCLAEAKHAAEQVGGFSPWAEQWGDRWRRQRERNGLEVRLSSSSVVALRSLWADENNPEWLRDYAFSHWARNVDDLAELAAISPESSHYEDAVWQRALRGDRSAAPYVREKASSNSFWFHLVPYVWETEFEPTVDAALIGIATDSEAKSKLWSNEYFEMSHLLRDIPTDAAERLLVRYWSVLGFIPLFVQAALYHGTDKLREVATISLAQIPQDAAPFEHIDSFFGFMTHGLIDRLSSRHLDSLEPYLAQLDDLCLDGMLDFCRRFDHWEWARRHLEPEMRRRVSQAQPEQNGDPPYITRSCWRWFPTDEELISALDELQLSDPRYRASQLSHWWDQFIERGDPDNRASGLLLEWLVKNKSPERFAIVAAAIGERGKRRDLEALLKLKPAGDHLGLIGAVADAEYAVKRRTLD